MSRLDPHAAARSGVSDPSPQGDQTVGVTRMGKTRVLNIIHRKASSVVPDRPGRTHIKTCMALNV